MKSCPFCAEQIQDQAIFCRFCKRSLTPVPPAQPANAATGVNLFTNSNSVDGKKLLKVIGIIALVIISFWLWYITIPGVVIWYIWTKKKFSRKTNIIATASLVVVFSIIGGSVAYAGRTPTLSITEPKNSYSVQAKTVDIKGKVSPAASAILIDGVRVHADNGGSFSYQAQLPSEGNNLITIAATNNGKQAVSKLTVSRIFTDEEKAAKAKADADAQAKAQADAEARAAAQAKADAQAKAEQAAYEKSPAGKLCTKYPNWTKEECDTIASHKVHIGMSEEQAIAAWGKPESINTTSSAYGKHEQWVYGLTSYLYFEGGVLTTIQN